MISVTPLSSVHCAVWLKIVHFAITVPLHDEQTPQSFFNPEVHLHVTYFNTTWQKGTSEKSKLSKALSEFSLHHLQLHRQGLYMIPDECNKHPQSCYENNGSGKVLGIFTPPVSHLWHPVLEGVAVLAYYRCNKLGNTLAFH